MQLNILPYLIENALELVLQLSALSARLRRLLACCWRSSGLDSSISNEHLTITYLLASWAIPLQFLLWLPFSIFYRTD